ncbi:MAG TPA: BrxA/BrxB family bacilliredoxin [Longimicrobiales bacterium]
MSFDDVLTRPAREELTRHGVRELRTAQDVDEALGTAGTVLLAFNSTCGCSSARMRPALVRALRHEPRPSAVVSVFAGHDLEATARAREHLAAYPPSSPSIFLLQDGAVVFALERRHIDGRAPDVIAADLAAAFDHFCADSTTS